MKQSQIPNRAYWLRDGSRVRESLAKSGGAYHVRDYKFENARAAIAFIRERRFRAETT